MTTLASFRLERRAGAGAMGEVWRATHRSGVPIAVKVVTGAFAGSATFAQEFRNEVRAIAALDHPNVVRVIDAGTIPDGVDALEPGGPWLAMEWADGVLEETVGGWDELKAALQAVLRGLACAHARGIVHRDVKPSNVLRCGGTLKLADFGLAALVEESEGDDRVRGTPLFMAPEQIRGEIRDQGPWTDLYAVGCMGWLLANGRPPFWGDSPHDVLVAHVSGSHGRWAPRFPVPAELGDWVRWLIERVPSARPGFAADALAALEAMRPPASGEGDDGIAGAPVSTGGASDTFFLDAVAGMPEPVAAPVPTVRREPAPVPIDWRHVDRAGAGALDATGLGLYGMREVPMVDREVERDLLWSALRDLDGPRAVVLEGASGRGKSRLAAWLAQLAGQTGAAHVVTLRHGPHGGAADGPAGAVTRWFRLTGLDDEAAERRVTRSRFGRTEDAAALVQIALHGGGRLRREVRHGALLQWLASLAADRPVVMWVDDAQWGLESLVLLRAALARRIRVLAVVTLRTEVLAEAPDARAELDALVADGAQRVSIGLLPSADHANLVDGLLGLHGAVAEQIRERTRGDPLFAVQLVRSCVERGVLEEGPGGYVLRDGAHPVLPDDVGEVWRARLDRLLVGRGPAWRDGLEIAALLGQEVSASEWRAACRAAGVPPEDDLVEALLEARLFDRTEGGWAFVHGMLRETVEAVAETHGRGADWHRACAEALADRADGPTRERRAMHLLAGDRREEGLEELMQASRAYEWRVEVDAGTRVIDRYDAVLDAFGTPAEDALRMRGLMRRIGLNRTTGRNEVALALSLDTVERFSSLPAAVDAVQMALDTLTSIAVVQGRLADARAWSDRLLEHATASGHPKHVALAAFGAAQLAFLQGDLDRADALFDRAALDDMTEPAFGVDLMRMRGMVACVRGDVPAARAAFREALDRARRGGVLLGVAFSLTGLGDAARRAGEYERALERYDEALAVVERSPLRVAQIRALRAIALVKLGRLDAADEEAEAARPPLRQAERWSDLLTVLAIRFAATVLAGGDGAALLDALERLWSERRPPPMEAARLLEAALHGLDGPPAERVRTLADAMWTAAGPQVRAALGPVPGR